MQDYPDDSERPLDECSRGWRSQARDRVRAQMARIVERSEPWSRSLLSRSILLETEAADSERPAPGEKAVDPLRADERVEPSRVSGGL